MIKSPHPKPKRDLKIPVIRLDDLKARLVKAVASGDQDSVDHILQNFYFAQNYALPIIHSDGVKNERR